MTEENYYPGTTTTSYTTGPTVQRYSAGSPKAAQVYVTSGPTIQTHSTLSPKGDVQEVVFSTIEEYLDKRNTISAEANRKKISKLLLPADVNLLFSDQAAIMQDFSSIVDREKKAIAADIDQFLKNVIETMDKVKDVLFQKSDNYVVQFDAYYKQFASKVNEFLGESINLIQK